MKPTTRPRRTTKSLERKVPTTKQRIDAIPVATFTPDEIEEEIIHLLDNEAVYAITGNPNHAARCLRTAQMMKSLIQKPKRASKKEDVVEFKAPRKKKEVE